MPLKKCRFCEAPTKTTDKFGFCSICSETFSILDEEEILEIDKRCFVRKTPDKEFLRTN